MSELRGVSVNGTSFVAGPPAGSELAFWRAELREAVGEACDVLERAGAVPVAERLREAATMVGCPPPDRNPLA